MLTRRHLLAAGAAGAATLVLPRSVFGANERIVTAHIGLGGQGRGNLRSYKATAGALCDVDSAHLAEALKVVPTIAEKNLVTDYRRILERSDIDAVVLSTPDHWHVPMAIEACEAGKDVYCEKPLSLTIAEGRRLVEAARKHGRIVQTGSQQRSSANFRQACELVQGGAIGKVKSVLVGIPGPNHPGEPVADSDPPAELDYNIWLGPAPYRPYNKKRVHYNFRFFRDYSGGQMTNWGAHHLDIAQWGLGRDDSGPVKVSGTGTFHPQRWHEVTETCRVTMTYDDGVTVVVGQGQKDIPQGTTFIGEKGRIFVNRGVLRAEPMDLLETKVDVSLYESKNHHGNFLDCVKSRKLPICDVEIGHRSATLCHLSNMVVELGRELTWDPKAERFADDEEANARLDRKPRDWKTELTSAR